MNAPLAPMEHCDHLSAGRQAVQDLTSRKVLVYCLGCGDSFEVGQRPRPPGPPSAPVLRAPDAAPTPPADHRVADDVDGLVRAGVVVRALADIPPFAGQRIGEVFKLKAGDVATVPAGVADILVKRQKAAVVEVAA